MRFKPLSIFLFAMLTVLLFSCKENQKTIPGSSTATIYHNGDIVTMEGAEAVYADAVVEQDGKIVFVGNEDQAKKEYPDAIEYDLKGQTLVPGLIEPHLHPSLAAMMLQNEIIAPYD